MPAFGASFRAAIRHGCCRSVLKLTRWINTQVAAWFADYETERFVEVMAESGLAHALALNPDIIILDISLPDLNGLEVATRPRTTGCGARVVFLSSCEDQEAIRAAFDLGASGYVFKSRIVPDLIATVKIAMSDVAISGRLSSEGRKRHVS